MLNIELIIHHHTAFFNIKTNNDFKKTHTIKQAKNGLITMFFKVNFA